ncbi:hypothetical protein [Corynebacterium aurimucosum]
MDFENLTVQQTVSSPGRDRMLSYDAGNKARLGNLTTIQLDKYDDAGLDAESSLSAEVTEEVTRLKANRALPPTTTINYGNSHVVVSETRYREDDVFAIWDRENSN